MQSSNHRWLYSMGSRFNSRAKILKTKSDAKWAYTIALKAGQEQFLRCTGARKKSLDEQQRSSNAKLCYVSVVFKCHLNRRRYWVDCSCMPQFRNSTRSLRTAQHTVSYWYDQFTVASWLTHARSHKSRSNESFHSRVSLLVCPYSHSAQFILARVDSLR
jgi:hypothetical protein